MAVGRDGKQRHLLHVGLPWGHVRQQDLGSHQAFCAGCGGYGQPEQDHDEEGQT